MDEVKYTITNKSTGEMVAVYPHGNSEENGVLFAEFAPVSEAGTPAWEVNPTLYRFINDGQGNLSSDIYDIVKDESQPTMETSTEA